MVNENDYSIKKDNPTIYDNIRRIAKVVGLGAIGFLGLEAVVTDLGLNKYTSSVYVAHYTIETEGIEDLSKPIWTRRTTEQIDHSPLWRLLFRDSNERIINEENVEDDCNVIERGGLDENE